MRRASILFAFSLLACGPPSPPAIAPETLENPDEAPPAIGATPDAAPTAAPSAAAPKPAAPPAAPKTLTVAEKCDKGNVEACFQHGEAKRTASPPDLAAARAAYDRGCGGISYTDACARLATMASKGEGGPVDDKRAAAAAKRGCGPFGAKDHNRAIRGAACVVLGEALSSGKGVAKDDRRAARAFKDGCELKNEAACKRHEAIQKKANAGKLPGANVNIAGMKVNGLAVKNLSCKTSGGGGLGALFGTMTLATGLAKRKARLDACSRGKKSETVVHWWQSGGRITKVEAKTQGKRNACVERALKGAPGSQTAECLATVHHGR